MKRFFLISLFVVLICYCASAGAFAQTRTSVISEVEVEYTDEIPPEVAALLGEDFDEEDVDSKDEDSDEDVDSEDEDINAEDEDSDEDADSEDEDVDAEDFETVYDWGEDFNASEVVYQWEDVSDDEEYIDFEDEDTDEDIDSEDEDADSEENLDEESDEESDEDSDSEEVTSTELPTGGVSVVDAPRVVTRGKVIYITNVHFPTEEKAFEWISAHIDVEPESVIFLAEDDVIVKIIINGYLDDVFEDEEDDNSEVTAEDSVETAYDVDINEDIDTEEVVEADEAAPAEENIDKDVDSVNEDTSSSNASEDGDSKEENRLNKGFFIGDCKPEYPETYNFSASEDPSED